MSNEQQKQQFALDYEAGNAYLENSLKQQQGVFGFEQDQETGLFDVEPLFDATQVGKKKTSGTTTSGSTTKKTKEYKATTTVKSR